MKSPTTPAEDSSAASKRKVDAENPRRQRVESTADAAQHLDADYARLGAELAAEDDDGSETEEALKRSTRGDRG
jgi:hypothetical protein